MSLRAKSSQSGSHVTTIIQNFTLVNLTSSIMPHRVWLLFGALGRFFDLHTWFPLLHTWLLLTLRIQASMYKAEKIFRLGIYKSSTCQGMRLDHLRTSPSSEEWPLGWTQPDFLPCVVVSLIILNDQGLTPTCQARWHRSLGITRDDRIWRRYTSGTVLEQLKTW